MNELLTDYGEMIQWVATVGIALGVIWGWVRKPLRDVKKDVSKLDEKLGVQLEDVKEDVSILEDKLSTKMTKFTDDTKHEMREFITDVKNQTMDLRENMGNVQDMADFLVADRLEQGRDHWVAKKFCPPESKKRLTRMYDLRHARGLNTVSTSFKDDILKLPDRRDGET